MKRDITWAAFAVAALFAAAQPAAATPVVNGDFATADLTGWYSTPTTAIAVGTAGYAPLQGTASALIVAVSTAAVTQTNTCAMEVWNTDPTCPQPLPFVAAGASLPTYGAPYINSVFFNGAFIGQDISVNANDVLSWNWFFEGDAADGARFFAIDSSGLGFGDIVHYGSGSTYTFTSGGTWSIYFGLFQGTDTWFYSTLTVDAIAVPEPGTLAMALAACIGLLYPARKGPGVTPTARGAAMS